MNQANFFLGYEVITMIVVLVITKEKILGTNFNQKNLMLVIWLLSMNGCFLYKIVLIKNCLLCPKPNISWKSIWIYLKSQIEFWNLKILFRFENFLPVYKFISKMGPVEWCLWCGCVKVYHMIRLNTRTFSHSAGSMFEIDFQMG